MNIILEVLIWLTYLGSLYFVIFWLLVYLDSPPQAKRKRIKDWPTVSVVVPAYNEENNIKPTVNSLLKLNYPRQKLEIIMVDDGSKDNTLKYMRELKKDNPKFDLKVIHKKNGGKGSALNLALKRMRGKYFVCMDADSFIHKGALKYLIPHFYSDNVAAVLPAMKVKDPKNALQKMQWYEYIINMFYKEMMGKLGCVSVAPGPFSVYNAKIVRKVGYFDEHNLTEDLEIALRLQEKNYELVQLLGTEVKTIAPSNIKALYRQRNRWYKGSILNTIKYKHLLFNKNYGDFGIMQMPSIVIGAILIVIAISFIIISKMKDLWDFVYHMSLVNFDFITYFNNINFNFKLIDLEYAPLVVGIILIGITLAILKKSHVVVKEKMGQFGALNVFLYFFLYFTVLGIFWLGIAYDLVRGKMQKW